jgi:hypothetical protein
MPSKRETTLCFRAGEPGIKCKRDCLEPGELASTKSFQDPMEMQVAISVGARLGT